MQPRQKYLHFVIIGIIAQQKLAQSTKHGLRLPGVGRNPSILELHSAHQALRYE